MHLLSENEFFDELEKEYGRYNEYNLKNARWYIKNFIRKDRLNDLLDYIRLYYISRDKPPKSSDMEFCIDTTMKKGRCNDPHIKDSMANQYDPDEFDSKNFVSREEAIQGMKIILDILKEKQKNNKNILDKKIEL